MSATPDNDPRHIEIMENWARKIVHEVAQEMADGIVERVGQIFLDAKQGNYDRDKATRLRFEVIEARIGELRKRP